MTESTEVTGSSRMKVYDISMPIYPGMPVYKNKPEKQPVFETSADFPTHGIHETRVHMDVHTGTHVDAPLHMMEQGATMESVTLEQLVRPCRVLDLTEVVGSVKSTDLTPHGIQAGEFVLLKTKNSFRPEAEGFDSEFIFVSEDGAAYLAERKVAGVGVDALGIERSQPEHPTHKYLFSAGAVIVEGLRLAEVPEGRYFLVAAPLNFIGTDAGPARILLLSGQLPL